MMHFFLKPDVCQDFFFFLPRCAWHFYKIWPVESGKVAWKSQGISFGLAAGNPDFMTIYLLLILWINNGTGTIVQQMSSF